MGFSTVVNSEPWYQWTYGAVFSNWNQGSQTIAILDNGEVWACMENFAMASQGEQAYAAWVGTISPDGAERKMGDLWAKHPTAKASGDEHGLRTTDTFAPHSTMYAAGDGNEIFTDGTTIYLLQQRDYDTGTGKGAGIWSLNPSTLALEHVAFDRTQPAIGEYYEDNHDATLATASKMMKPVWWNGAFYFWDAPQRSGDYDRNHVLRRWEPGGGVSTVTPSLKFPTDYVGGNWLAQVNPTTGLPNGLNSDVVDVGNGAQYMCSDVHNDWLYFHGATTASTAGSGYDTMWIRRLDLNNPDNGVETLYYGLSDYDWQNQVNRDDLSDFASSPTGIPLPVANPTYRSAIWPGLGTPQLLGFQPDSAWGAACVVGDDFIFLNSTTGTFYSGFQITGYTLCAINIPELLTAVEDNDGKPIRHDRTNPFFRTIANGTANDHSLTDHNWKNRWAGWLTMDGGTPAFTHPNPGSLVTNPNSPQWAGKAVFLANSVDNTMEFNEYHGPQAHFVKVLEPKGSTDRDFNVTFSFEGKVLKGYGPAVGIEEAYAPEEVILQ